MIVAKGVEWWQKHVLTRQPPEGGEVPPINFLAAIERQPGSVVELPPDVELTATLYEDAKQRERDWKARAEELRTELIQSLGEHEIGLLPDGRRVEYKASVSRRFDTKGFRADHPELAAEYTKETTYRTLYVKRPKKKANKAKKGAERNGAKDEKRDTAA